MPVCRMVACFNSVGRPIERYPGYPMSHQRAPFSIPIVAERVTDKAGLPKAITVLKNVVVRCR